jgi:hypothetical protein
VDRYGAVVEDAAGGAVDAGAAVGAGGAPHAVYGCSSDDVQAWYE